METLFWMKYLDTNRNVTTTREITPTAIETPVTRCIRGSILIGIWMDECGTSMSFGKGQTSIE
jgi:hypothetical protein